MTDGIPNVEPPRGHIRMLERYYEQHQFRCMISCYGFGYDLDSKLLMDISDISGGDGFCFIPDASLLGNVFIHGISNIVTTAKSYPKLMIKLLKGAKFLNSETELTFNIDSLKYGKEKNMVLNLDTSECESQSTDYLQDCAQITLEVNGKEYQIERCSAMPPNYYRNQTSRISSINMIDMCIQKLKRDRF